MLTPKMKEVKIMMWEEFEKIAGYKVSFETYNNVIEPMYMAINVSKQEFVKMLDKKAFALPTASEIKKEMKKIAFHLFEICGHSTDWQAEENLMNLAEKYAKMEFGYTRNNPKMWIKYEKGYEYTNERGCHYIKSFTVMYGYTEIKTIKLI